METDNEIMIM